jgi:DNA-binding NarL/FixJ family response regulator
MEEEPCDLLIADLKTAEIDGPALYAEVVARWPAGGPRVLLMSGFADAAAV